MITPYYTYDAVTKRLSRAPDPATIDGRKVVHPSAAMCARMNPPAYPLADPMPPAPTPPEGKVAVFDGYEVSGGKWVQKWRFDDAPEPEPSPFDDLPAADLVARDAGITELTNTVNIIKNAIRTAFLLVAVLLSPLLALPASVETDELVNLRGASNVVTRVDLSGLAEVGDDRVYEASSLGDFEWSSDRADILAALGSQQPYVSYESGDQVEWCLDFYVGETNYWGYAWAEASARSVTFDVYGYYYHWDEGTGEEVYGEDYATVTGTRESQGAVPTGDRYARQSDMTSAQAEMSSIRALYNGETKVMRDGGEGQYGYGWGYLQHPLSGEARYWRIRVPKWTAFPGATTNNMACTDQWGRFPYDPRVYTSPERVTYGMRVVSVMPANPASWCPTWGVRRRLSSTRGVNGTDAVAMADWDVGFSLLATNGTDLCALNFRVAQTATDPMSYIVTPDVRAMQPVDILCSQAGPADLTPATTNVWYIRYVDLAPETRSIYIGSPVYRTFNVTTEIKAFLVEPTSTEVCTNGTLAATWWTLLDMSCTGSAAVTVTNALVCFTATATCASLASLEDARVPYYRLVTSLDGHLYYDAALDETYRVVSSNGVFFSEWHCEGDWRRAGL